MSMWPATALPPGVHPSALTAAALLMPSPRNWIQTGYSLGVPFSVAVGLTMATHWRWIVGEMFMWGGTAQRLGVHPPAASPGASTFLPPNWIQAERSLGIRFLAAGRVTFASRWRWMPMEMSVWRAGAMPRGVRPSVLLAAAHMM